MRNTSLELFFSRGATAKIAISDSLNLMGFFPWSELFAYFSSDFLSRPTWSITYVSNKVWKVTPASLENSLKLHIKQKSSA